MKLFQFVTTVKGGESFRDHYEGDTEAEAKEFWAEDIHRYQIPMEKITVEIAEVNPETFKPL